jgi:hypothetical protein
MDRRLSPETLIEYHFGTLEGPARTAVEETLLESEDALRAYLRLKRELDGAYSAEDVPSPAAKARLRAAVQQEVGARQSQLAAAAPAVVLGLRADAKAERRSLLAVFWRPIPLYQTLAVGGGGGGGGGAGGGGRARRAGRLPGPAPIRRRPGGAGGTHQFGACADGGLHRAKPGRSGRFVIEEGRRR